MADGGQSPSPLERWLSLAGNVIAPATVITALLFYFGYVSSRSEFEYFGLDVDTIGLTTQGFVMRSPQALLLPLLVLSLLGAGAVLLHAAIRRRLAVAFASPDPGPASRAVQWIRRAIAGGLLLMAAGLILVLLYSLLREWPLFDLVTPLVIALGGSITAYALGALRFAANLAPGSATVSVETSATSVLLRPAVSVFILVAVAASIFWANATVAQWTGLGLARYRALHTDELPSVILDTKERLFLTSPGINEVVLPPSEGQTFHYRYRHLRLLIHGNDRMFLVPDRWSASNSTMLVRLDNNVRMQFQFTNQPP